VIHKGVDGPLTASLGVSVYFMTLMEYSTGFITATPIKTKGMVPEVIESRIEHLETLKRLRVKRVRHGGAEKYFSRDLHDWYAETEIMSEMMAQCSSQQNRKAERSNRFIVDRVREELLDAGSREGLWAEALSSLIHVLNRASKAGHEVTPLEALMTRCPDVKGFRVWGRRKWALNPKQQ